MICPKCGEELPKASKFCNKCGSEVLVEEIKQVNADTANIADQANVKGKSHFVMKKIFIFPIVGTVLFVLYYVALHLMNVNGYQFVGNSSYLTYLTPISIVIIFYILPLVITFKNRNIIKKEVKNVVNNVVKNVVNNVVKKKFSTPVKIVIIITLIIVIVGGSVVYSKQKNLNAEVTYMADLNQVVSLVATQGALIETDAQAISSVWHDAIFNDSHVTVNGKYASTFDEAIQYKNEEFEANGEMDTLVKGKAEIQKLMETLSNPPSKHKDAYEVVMKIFNSYNDFETMVESPTGSLTEYNQKFSTLDSSLTSQLKEFSTRYPNK